MPDLLGDTSAIIVAVATDDVAVGVAALLLGRVDVGVAVVGGAELILSVV